MKENGLSSKEAEEKLRTFGFNEIRDINKKSIFSIFLDQIKNNFIIYLLLIAMILSFVFEESITGYVVFVVILVVILTGFFQEYKAEKAIESLKNMLMPISIVIRDGEQKEILSKEIVPGDVLILRNGEKIPADCVVLNQNEVLVDESVLTGESMEVKKKVLYDSKNILDENMLFTGSFLISGKCIARVVCTGMETRFGKIAGMISVAEKELPLRKKINSIAKYIAIFAILSSIFTGIFIFAMSGKYEMNFFTDTIIIVIALCVSAFPEGFPLVLTSSLSVGMHRMAKQNVIVNRMSVIETLGETTVICSDKTGTITRGEMTVKKIYSDGKVFDITGEGYEGNGFFYLNEEKINPLQNINLSLLIKSSVLCNDSRIERTGDDMIFKIYGNPTEAALLVMLSKARVFKEDFKNIETQKEFLFSSERKMMSVVMNEKNKSLIYSKGALSILLKKCSYIKKEERIIKLTEMEKEKILSKNDEFTLGGFRTLGIAYKQVKNQKNFSEDELVFLGIIAMEDPPRAEVKEALIICMQAGIDVKMITGDDKKTAISVANQIGLNSSNVLEGDEIEKLSDEKLVKIVKNISIFARVKPEHKLRIVRALKENGEIVTMTGDGVNDAPALKEAHIGVAMGKNGTDVSRSVADLTLKDDNFVTIVSAIKEGRTIFKNIQKFLSYQLSCNYSEFFVLFIGVLLSPILGWPIPILLALQILFMNLVTDDFPAVTLGLNPYSKDVMSERPRKKKSLLNKDHWLLLVLSGTLMAIVTLGTFYFTYNVLGQSESGARTTTLLTLIFVEIMGAFNFRSFRKGVFNRSLLVNPYLMFASLISLAFTILIIYSPLNSVFGTIPVPIIDWLVVFGFSLIFVAIFDLFKFINNKKMFFNFE